MQKKAWGVRTVPVSKETPCNQRPVRVSLLSRKAHHLLAAKPQAQHNSLFRKKAFTTYGTDATTLHIL